MVHCMFGNAFGCIVWCPSAFTSLPGLESFPLCFFRVLIPLPGFMTPTVGPSCATHLLSCLEQASLDVVSDILSDSISYTWRCTHMQVKDLQGPVVQSVVSLTSLLRVISLTVLADSLYNIMIFFAEKMWVAFALQKLHIFSAKNYSIFAYHLM